MCLITLGICFENLAVYFFRKCVALQPCHALSKLIFDHGVCAGVGHDAARKCIDLFVHTHASVHAKQSESYRDVLTPSFYQLAFQFQSLGIQGPELRYGGLELFDFGVFDIAFHQSGNGTFCIFDALAFDVKIGELERRFRTCLLYTSDAADE